MRSTLDVRPEGSALMASPGFTVPDTMVPEKPRKFWFGRFTHCTGMRKGFSARSSPTGTVSRCAISVGPWYHGMLVERVIMLSPMRAETGITVISSAPIDLAKAR